MIASLLFGAFLCAPPAMLLGVALGRLDSERQFSKVQHLRREVKWAEERVQRLLKHSRRWAKRRLKAGLGIGGGKSVSTSNGGLNERTQR